MKDLLPADQRSVAPRRAAPADLPAIVAIYNETIAGRQSTADLEPIAVHNRRSWFEARDPARRPIWVIDGAAGEVAAWLSLDDYKARAAYSVTAEVSVYVSAAHRRAGLARRLLQHALSIAPSLELTTILAVIFGHNAPSIALFESAGFERWGLLPAVTRLDGHDADVVILGRRV